MSFRNIGTEAGNGGRLGRALGERDTERVRGS